MTIIKYKDFMKVAEKINRRKYHLCVTLRLEAGEDRKGEMYVTDYVLYRKNLPLSVYFAKENKAILSSKAGKDFIDLERWVKINGE